MRMIFGPGEVYTRPLDPRDGNEWERVGTADEGVYKTEPWRGRCYGWGEIQIAVDETAPCSGCPDCEMNR